MGHESPEEEVKAQWTNMVGNDSQQAHGHMKRKM